MIITWDEPKRLANIDKHGLDFEAIDDFDWHGALITLSHSRRYKAIGKFMIVWLLSSIPGWERRRFPS